MLASTLVGNTDAQDRINGLSVNPLFGYISLVGASWTDFNTVGVDTTDGDGVIMNVDIFMDDESCDTNYMTE